MEANLIDLLIFIGDNINKDILIKCINKLIKPKSVPTPPILRTDLIEIQGDLFTSSDPTSSLAHCVAKDFGMGKGIAVYFKKKYGGLSELKAQNPDVGSMAVLETPNNKFVYYLVTKLRSSGYPTIDNLIKSLTEMRNHAVKHGVKMISMPRIGSGLDKLDWNLVKNAINCVFKGTEIKIRIYYL